MNWEFNEHEGESAKGLKLLSSNIFRGDRSTPLKTLLRTPPVLCPVKTGCAGPVYPDLWIFWYPRPYPRLRLQLGFASSRFHLALSSSPLVFLPLFTFASYFFHSRPSPPPSCILFFSRNTAFPVEKICMCSGWAYVAWRSSNKSSWFPEGRIAQQGSWDKQETVDRLPMLPKGKLADAKVLNLCCACTQHPVSFW